MNEIKSHHKINQDVLDSIETAFGTSAEREHWILFAYSLFMLYQMDAPAIGHLRGAMEDELIRALGWRRDTEVALFLRKEASR